MQLTVLHQNSGAGLHVPMRFRYTVRLRKTNQYRHVQAGCFTLSVSDLAIDDRGCRSVRHREQCCSVKRMWSSVGASLLAMVVNDNAYLLAKRGALESIASKLAPTGIGVPPGLREEPPKKPTDRRRFSGLFHIRLKPPSPATADLPDPARGSPIAPPRQSSVEPPVPNCI